MPPCISLLRCAALSSASRASLRPPPVRLGAWPNCPRWHQRNYTHAVPERRQNDALAHWEGDPAAPSQPPRDAVPRDRSAQVGSAYRIAPEEETVRSASSAWPSDAKSGETRSGSAIEDDGPESPVAAAEEATPGLSSPDHPARGATDQRLQAPRPPTSTILHTSGASTQSATGPRSRRKRRAAPVHPRHPSHGEHKDRALSPSLRALVAARPKGAGEKDKHVRARLPSLQSPVRTSAIFSSGWYVRFAQLSRRYDRYLPQYYLQEQQALLFEPQVREWVDIALSQMQDAESVAGAVELEALARQYGTDPHELWSSVALWLLCHEPETAVDFLQATHSPTYRPPINWVEDCLQFLARQNLLSPGVGDDRRQSEMQKLLDAFLMLLKLNGREQYNMDGSFVRLVLPHAIEEQTQQLWQAVKGGRVKVNYHTFLNFADHFAKNGRLEQSLGALVEAKGAGAWTDRYPFRAVCAALLRRSIEHPEGLRFCLRLIETLVGIGLKLDRRLCNIVMLNAVEAGDHDTAMAVNRSALEQGLPPSAHTYAILLKMCKADINNGERLRQVIQDAIADGHVRGNVVLATEILHCLALHHIAQNPKNAFHRVMEAYLQLFDPGPLERMGVPFPTGIRDADDTAQPRLSPPPHAIAALLAVLFYDKDMADPIATLMYDRWRTLVESGDQELARCAETPHLSNIFLRHFVRKKSTLLQATRIVKDMQRDLPASATVAQAPPDVYTWSIFLDGFARRGEAKLAEQILRYMQSKGLQPNVVTWSSLVCGHAAAQDVEGVLATVRRMEASGMALNEWTYRNMRHLREKRRLKELLDQQRLQGHLDFTGELKKGLQRKLSAPEEAAAASGV